MIYCVQIDKLGENLQALTGVMDLYQQRDPAFPDRALGWLTEAEKSMGRLRLPEGSEMATLRGRITRAEDQALDEEGRPTRKVRTRARNAAAAEALERAEAILRGRVTAAEERLQQFEDKLCEGMTAFLLEHQLPPRNVGQQEWLKQIWAMFSAGKATRPLSIYLSASLSLVDRLFILDRVLARVGSQ